MSTSIEEAELRVTKADLAWWLDLAPTLDWIFAVTYAEGAPHHYVAEGKSSSLTHHDFVRAARVIRTFGEPAKFYRTTRIYLHSPDGRYKWWTMDSDVTKTTLINRGDASHVYGPQNAPRTTSAFNRGHHGEYDALASAWDSTNQISEQLAEALRSAVTSRLGTRPRRLLDIGCGTGAALDIGLTEPTRYVGIDPSRAMLNELVAKYPYTAGIHPMPLADAVNDHVLSGTRFDGVLALGGSASYLSPHELRMVFELSKDLVVLTHYAPDSIPFTSKLSADAASTALAEAQEISSEAGGHQLTMDGFIVTVV